MKNQKLFVNNIGDLSEAQRASFYHFLSSGISEEISNFPNPFITNVRISPRKKTPCLVYLYPNEMKLKGPLNTPDMCFQSDLSYTLKIYISGEYSYPVNHKKQKEPAKALLALKFNRRLRIQQTRVKQDIFLGEIPLMTEEGTFIINGCERIVISQIIRSPGVYFRKELGAARTTIYTATIISNKGLWTKMVYDTCALEEDPSRERSRIYMKLNDYRRNGNLNRCEKRKCNDANKLFFGDLLMYFGLTFQEVYDSLEHPIHLETLEFQFDESAFLMESLYLNQGSGCFSIGEIGRYKLNKKFGFHFSKEITYLTAHDFLKILDGLIELKYYNRVGDDIDDIKNKLIRSVGELLQNQLRIGFYRLQKNLSVNSPVPNSKKMSFDLEVLADPEPWILDPRPLTNSIRDFFKTSQLSQYMDQINPLAELTHKRRISVFGPNGLKRDHISTVIRDIHPSQYGRLCPVETPEGQNAGLIASVAMYARIGLLGSLETPYFFMKDATVYSSKHPIYLNPDQESETKVAFCDFSIDPIEKKLTPFLSVKENYFFSVQEAKEIHFLTTSPVQIISLATSLIPFIEHDDANRALMGSNMQRQAVPLLYTQKPIVGTGFESVAILDSGMVIKNYSQGKVEFSSSYSIQVKDPFNQTITYFLKKYTRSNQETCLNQRPLVWIGESVFSGQVIADGPATNDGELALGRNLTLAYMPWEGYNYEDAIVISERVLVDDCLTSVHIEEYETNITYYISKSEKITKRKLRHLTKYSRRLLNKHGIVRLGSYVREGDVLVGKLAPSADEPSAERKILEAVFKKKKKKIKKRYRDTSLKVAPGTEGRVVEIRVLQNQESLLAPSWDSIRIYIAQIRKVQVGDKLAGRHGNKGIISRILPRQDMPYLPDGTPIDIIFNPLGVPSRMNVGQVFECLLGLAGEKLGSRFKVTPFDEIYGKEASRILVNQKLKEAAILKKEKWLFHSHYPGKILLRDGRTGEFFDNPITVGKSYILKLIHLVEDKIHARATGPYSMITEQPLAGKSQRGGQRFGEMEVWALEAFGCSYTLQELLTIKSDDIDGRNDIYESILVRKEMEKPIPSIPEAFFTLMRELHSLGLDFSFQKIQSSGNFHEKIQIQERNLFEEMETRLKLRNLIARKKTEYFPRFETEKKEEEEKQIKKEKEKEKVIQDLQPFFDSIETTSSLEKPEETI